MTSTDLIINKIKGYITLQRLIDLVAYLILCIATVLISASIALLLFKSPFYAIIGIIPILFYRPISLIKGAQHIEQKLGLKGELVQSVQLSSITKDNREKYSQELINAYIDDAALKIKNIDPRHYITSGSLYNAFRILLISIALALIHPAIMPARFWYSLHHTLNYFAEPKKGAFVKGTEINLVLHVWGVHEPKKALLFTVQADKTVRENIAVENGVAKKSIKITEPVSYHFEFLEHKTEKVKLATIEPMYVENLSFRLEYPVYTKLKPETTTGRQLIAPKGTRVNIFGRTSAKPDSGWLEFGDTTRLAVNDNEFTGTFVIRESGVAVLHLLSYSELKEEIRIYAVPDLAPLVNIFSPGYNINMPYDMKVNIGIKCGDDYGLKNGKFFYAFKDENKRDLALRKGALEDTVFFTWNLSRLGMLPGDKISYFVEVNDYGGNITKTQAYFVYFPTMEEIYKEVSKKEDLLHREFEDLKAEHSDEIEEIARIHEKIMKQRELSWAEKEKLKEVIEKEEEILKKIENWQQELERTIEKLNQGIVLDQKSIERLREMVKILREIVPEEMWEALQDFQLELGKKPEDMKRALENFKDAQQELAKALERALEILKRYRQEEKLKELAEYAQDLAHKIDKIDTLVQQGKTSEADKQTKELNKAINELANMLKELSESEGLEKEIKQSLEDLAKQTKNISDISLTSLGKKKKELNLIAAELEKLYENLTKGRAAKLRKKLLEILNQLIEISKLEEKFFHENIETRGELQEQIISVTKIVAESLYTQQTKSYYVTPNMGKNLARAIKHMEKSTQDYAQQYNARDAMKLLNLVCLEMLQRLEELTKGGSSSGMDKLLQGLADIANGQMSLNQSLSGIFPIPIAGLTGEQMMQLEKLAGRQRELRQALESLQAEAGQGQHQEFLENIINEMKKAEEKLYHHKLDRELIERQQIILSRLLDAQRSIRKEDYGKGRTSKPGKDFLEQKSPKPLPQELGRDQLRELIQQALRESYPKEYELYIREYFKRLLEEK